MHYHHYLKEIQMTDIKDLQDYVSQLKLIDKREKLKITKQLEAKKLSQLQLTRLLSLGICGKH